jgi:hypothetical protein
MPALLAAVIILLFLRKRTSMPRLFFFLSLSFLFISKVAAYYFFSRPLPNQSGTEYRLPEVFAAEVVLVFIFLYLLTHFKFLSLTTNWKKQVAFIFMVSALSIFSSGLWLMAVFVLPEYWPPLEGLLVSLRDLSCY